MKNLKLAFVIIAISVSSIGSITANNTDSQNPTATLREKIVELLGHHQYNLDNTTLQAEVSVMVNNKNELIVVSVDTTNKELEFFVIYKLNYKKIDVKGIAKGTIYKLPLKVE